MESVRQKAAKGKETKLRHSYIKDFMEKLTKDEIEAAYIRMTSVFGEKDQHVASSSDVREKQD